MSSITINLDETFENGEVDISHAIDTMLRFLKHISETGEVNADKVDIERFAFKNDQVQDTVDQLGMELAVCAAIKRICNKIIIAVQNRETSNEKMITSLNELINRK